jgi:hypothetical protein
MVTLQEQKVALELKQAEISLREIDHNQKIADKSISAQAEDRKDQRKVEKEMHRQGLIFGGVVTVCTLLFILVALYMDKDALVLDLVKVVVGFVGGFGASAIWHHQRGKRNSPEDD